nr:hypothetical protein BaRGS_005124 [Batillaria attramentaria]
MVVVPDAVSQQDSGFVRGLKEEGVPVSPLKGFGQRYLFHKLDEIVTGKGNEVILTEYAYVPSLERKVVVHLPGKQDTDEIVDTWIYNVFNEKIDRHQAMSRCCVCRGTLARQQAAEYGNMQTGSRVNRALLRANTGHAIPADDKSCQTV